MLDLWEATGNDQGLFSNLNELNAAEGKIIDLDGTSVLI